MRTQPRCIIRASVADVRIPEGYLMNNLSFASYPMRRAMEMSIRFLVHFSIMVYSLTILLSDNRWAHHYSHENVRRRT